MQTIQEDRNTVLREVSMQPVLVWEAPGFPDEGGKSKLPPRGKPQASPDPALCVPFLSLSLFFGKEVGRALLSLCCWAQVFSSCSKWGLLFVGVWVSHCGGFSCWVAQALGTRASVVAARGFSSWGAHAYFLLGVWNLPGPEVEPESLAWQGILNHCTTREAPLSPDNTKNNPPAINIFTYPFYFSRLCQMCLSLYLWRQVIWHLNSNWEYYYELLVLTLFKLWRGWSLEVLLAVKRDRSVQGGWIETGVSREEEGLGKEVQ